MKKEVLVLGEYPYTVVATADGGATEEVSSLMKVDDAAPAPIVTPTSSRETQAGILLEYFNIGKAAEVPTAEKDGASAVGDGISYVAGIKVCRESADATTISGVEFTMRSSTSGKSTVREIIGEDGDCAAEQAVLLGGAQCIQMVNLVTDADGNTVRIAFRRNTGDEVESIGYGEGTFQGQYSVDFGDEGCLTGYELGFWESDVNGEADQLRSFVAVSNPNLQNAVAITAALTAQADEVSDPGAE
jgi:hypothetical protein